MKSKLTNTIGWYGVLAILVAYGLVTFDVVAAKSWPYQLLNLTGALGLIVVALSHKDTQPVVLNIVWALVAVIAIIQLIIK
jgi:hypothetical protein